jgi:glyoxylate reductase
MPERGLSIIKQKFDAEVWRDYAPPPKKTIIEKATSVDALATLLSDKIDAEVFDVAPKLKIVAQMAVGFDNIDVGEATKRGIYVTNTPGVLTETTADFAWALLMAVARRIVEADTYVRSGNWKVSWHPMMMQGRDVYGATLGIVGLGRIGCAIAKRAKGFDMKVLYHDVIRRPDFEKEYDIQMEIAKAYEGLGNNEKAISEWLKVLYYGRSEVPKLNIYVKYILAEICEKVGLYDKALKFYEEIIEKEGAVSDFGKPAQKGLERIKERLNSIGGQKKIEKIK